MLKFLLIAFALSSSVVFSRSTIDDVQRLFDNTIKKWGIEIKDKRDYQERFRRLERSKEIVDETSSEVLLDALNRFSVNNDEEEAALEAVAWEQSNRTMQLMMEDEENRINLQQRGRIRKRDKVENLESTLDSSNSYWEYELGLPPIEDQMGCGSCFIFPAKTAIEALYKQMTGVEKVFSAQYFVDCNHYGCGGGQSNTVFKTVSRTQFMLSDEDMPYTADYVGCPKFHEITKEENNALGNIWQPDFYLVERSEKGFIKALRDSPVAFGSYISLNYFSYSGGLYSDIVCAINPIGHAQLLVGFSRTFFRVRGSYGYGFGEQGYINYKRDAPGLVDCEFFDWGFIPTLTWARDIEYRFCSKGKVVSRKDCKLSCAAMNKDGETGWELAVIPTKKHNLEVIKMANDRWPGIKKKAMFSLLWIGLVSPDGIEFQWNSGDGPYDVKYFSFSGYYTGDGKYGLLNKNNGFWVLKNNLKLTARGVCSRIKTCYDFTTHLRGHGSVTYSVTDTKHLVEGTTANIACHAGYELMGASQVTCITGQWDGDDNKLPKCVEVDE